MRVRLQDDTICIGRHLQVHFQRTLRIPEDGGVYPLPPGLGRFPVRRVRDFARRVPAAWAKRGGYFIPMYQREALWLAFDGAYWRPNALQVLVGGVNAVSGGPLSQRLRKGPQDYLVVPEQPWLDGINAGDGFIRQFVAMPLGQGYTVEAQVTGKEDEGGIQLVAYDPKPGRFPNLEPRPTRSHAGGFMVCEKAMAPMGLGAGGRMVQKIYPDAHGVRTWDAGTRTEVAVQIVNSAMYRYITGEAPPPSPISAATYTQHGYPWFALYDEHKGDVAALEMLRAVRSVSTLEEGQGIADADDSFVIVPACPVHGFELVD